MEVHHHSHTERRKFTHYLWEFLMLFLAVFCGFLAENQREHIVERHRAEDYAQALVRDLKADTSNINKWTVYYSLFISDMDSMINMAINKQISLGSSGKFAWDVRNSLWHVPLPWQRTTLEQIKSSGNIRYFKNYKLQEMISNYNTGIENFIQAFILENSASDKARELTNQILDSKTYYEYSKTNLMFASTQPHSYIDSLTNRIVLLENKGDLINELVNTVIYRRRNYVLLRVSVSQIKIVATDLLNELEKTYHLK